MRAIVIEKQYFSSRLHVAREDIPGGANQLVPLFEDVGIGQTAGGDDDDVGPFRKNVLRLGEHIVADLDAGARATLQPPVDDADEFTASLCSGGKSDLAPGLGGGLQYHHLVAALGRDPGCFQPCRPSSDDHDLAAWARAGGDNMRHGSLTAGRRIVDAESAAAFVNTVKAIGGPHAGPDFGFPPLADLERDM